MKTGLITSLMCVQNCKRDEHWTRVPFGATTSGYHAAANTDRQDPVPHFDFSAQPGDKYKTPRFRSTLSKRSQNETSSSYNKLLFGLEDAVKVLGYPYKTTSTSRALPIENSQEDSETPMLPVILIGFDVDGNLDALRQERFDARSKMRNLVGIVDIQYLAGEVGERIGDRDPMHKGMLPLISLVMFNANVFCRSVSRSCIL